MKNSCYNYLFLYLIGLALCWAIVFTTSFASAEKDSQGQKDSEDEKIRITADRLTTDTEARWADFIGNVRAIQGSTVLTADRLKIFYKQLPESAEKEGPNEASIEKIVANGHVNIKFENRLAVSDQAVYTSDTRVLVLTGPNSKITSGNNSVSGEKITFHREDGRIIVEGGTKDRVEAVFYSEDSGLK
jgi:lipopolysaccharide export system protein LptA